MRNSDDSFERNLFIFYGVLDFDEIRPFFFYQLVYGTGDLNFSKITIKIKLKIWSFFIFTEPPFKYTLFKKKNSLKLMVFFPPESMKRIKRIKKKITKYMYIPM